jgi:hypothetical protein
MLVEVPEPWTPAQATERIRSIASGEFDLSYKRHALDQLAERGLIIGDVTFLLRNGFVYVPPEEATRKPYWRYQMQCRTPNSNNRSVRCIVIPDWKRKQIKVLTVMWADETRSRGR